MSRVEMLRHNWFDGETWETVFTGTADECVAYVNSFPSTFAFRIYW